MCLHQCPLLQAICSQIVPIHFPGSRHLWIALLRRMAHPQPSCLPVRIRSFPSAPNDRLNNHLPNSDLSYWPNLILKAALYNAYWFAAGCVGMGLCKYFQRSKLLDAAT